MNRFFKENKRWLLTGACLIILYWALLNYSIIINVLSSFISLIMPFIIGCVIAFILNVPMRFIENHLPKSSGVSKKASDNDANINSKEDLAAPSKLRRVISFTLTIIILIAIITLAMFIVVPQLATTIAELFKEIPEGVNRLYNWLLVQLAAFPDIEQKLQSISIDWDAVLKSVIDFISIGSKGFINGSIGAISGIVSGVTTFFIGFVFAIYILFQKEKLALQFKKVLYAMLSKNHADKVLEIASLASSTFSSFLSGQCLEATILGSMFCITMLIIRLPYAFLIGIVIAITALIPIVGAFIGCIVGIILIGLVSPVKAVIFVIMFLVLQQIEGNLIYPHVVGSSVGLPGMWVLVAVTIGGNMFGIAGMLTFIPICSVVYALFRTYINNRLKKKNIHEEV